MAELLLIAKFLAFFGLVHATLILPGYAIIKQLRWFTEHDLQLVFSYGISMLLYAGLALLHFAVGFSIWAIELVAVAGLAASVWVVFRQGLELRRFVTLPFIALVVMSATSLAWVSLPLHRADGYIPDPTPRAGRNYNVFNVKILNLAHTPANDNYIPFRQAQFFVNRMSIANDSFISEWDVNFFYRTPLMGAVTAFYYELLHEQIPRPYLWATPTGYHGHVYEQFQILAQILNSLFIVPAYLLLTALFRKRLAQLTVLFLVFSPFFLYNSFFSWPKSLVAYFILCSWILLRRRERPILVGAFSGMAYLVHDLSILYLAGSVVYLLVQRAWGYLAKMGVVLAALALPWLVLARLVFHQTSLFFYYPFSLNEIPSDPSHVIADFFHTPLKTIVSIKLRAVYDLLAHLELRHWLTNQWRTYVWADTLTTIPGAIGLTLFPFAYVEVARKLRRDWRILLPMVITPLAVLFVMLGRPKSLGIGAMHFAEALVPILTAYGVSWLARWSRWLMTAVFASIVMSYYFMVGFSYDFDFTGWTSAVSVATITFAVACQLIMIYLFVAVVFERYPRNRWLARLLA